MATRFEEALLLARSTLWGARDSRGVWAGRLSTSALSTATAVTALEISRCASRSAVGADAALIDRGLAWLAAHQNSDGGWGDTVKSLSNVSTTVLAWSAFGAVSGADTRYASRVSAAEAWLTRKAGSLRPEALARVVSERYGRDRTFSVPILTLATFAGRMGVGAEGWRHVVALPFELAVLPHSWFAALRLPVVSYALPALIGMGLARHRHMPSRNPVARWARSLSRSRALRVLERIQPSNGGFLEATPLTSFVTMSLAGSGGVDHPATRRGLEFLRASVLPDGSWPIDTNLSTWVTTLAIQALGEGCVESSSDRDRMKDWLLGQQFTGEHPYTHAAPGGWAWTHLPGGVPDADDTAGALLALRRLDPSCPAARRAAMDGLRWLLDLQNRDGGIPTFCRGWGALPFDRSGADLTAHGMRAWLAWFSDVPAPLQARLRTGLRRGVDYLARVQREDGSWLPLWFGNQHAPDDENPTYGTARVLAAVAEAEVFGMSVAGSLSGRALDWLAKTQHDDGSWGWDGLGSGTVEESALVVEALGMIASLGRLPDRLRTTWRRGVDWLVAQVERGAWNQPSPIGFYFAKLWYYEAMYPLIFTVAALERAKGLFQPPAQARNRNNLSSGA